MKIGNVVLLLFVASIIIQFTKLKNWFPLSIGTIAIIGLLGFFLKYVEIHKENKKRREYANEVRVGGDY